MQQPTCSGVCDQESITTTELGLLPGTGYAGCEASCHRHTTREASAMHALLRCCMDAEQQLSVQRLTCPGVCLRLPIALPPCR